MTTTRSQNRSVHRELIPLNPGTDGSFSVQCRMNGSTLPLWTVMEETRHAQAPTPTPANDAVVLKQEWHL